MARTRFGTALGVSLWLFAQTGLAAVVPPLPQPTWKELNAEQQRVLAPLAGEWDKMEGFRRKKWLGIAQRYQTMTPEEQGRMQRRMTTWVKLSPEERLRAREKYRSLQKAPPEKKQALKKQWEQYTELPEAEKARLAEEAARKKASRAAKAKPASSQAPPKPPPKHAAGQAPAKAQAAAPPAAR